MAVGRDMDCMEGSDGKRLTIADCVVWCGEWDLNPRTPKGADNSS